MNLYLDDIVKGWGIKDTLRYTFDPGPRLEKISLGLRFKRVQVRVIRQVFAKHIAFRFTGPNILFSPAIGEGRIQLHISWQSSARLQVFVYDKSPSRCSMHNCFLSSQVFILGYSTYVVFLAIRIKPEM